MNSDDAEVRLTTLNLSLPEGLKAYVESQVALHGYTSASEFIRTLLREHRDRWRTADVLRDRHLDYLRSAIEKGAVELERGEVVDGEAFFDQLEREGAPPAVGSLAVSSAATRTPTPSAPRRGRPRKRGAQRPSAP